MFTLWGEYSEQPTGRQARREKITWPCRSDPASIVANETEAVAAQADFRAAPPTTGLKGDAAMRVMVIVKATEESEAGVMPEEELLTRMGKYNEELVKAGILLAGDGLRPSSEGKRVIFADGKKTVIDGPFTETKELIAGFWIWQVRSMEEALEWVRRCPDPMPGKRGQVEIRRVFEPGSFADRYSPELRQQAEQVYLIGSQGRKPRA